MNEIRRDREYGSVLRFPDRLNCAALSRRSIRKSISASLQSPNLPFFFASLGLFVKDSTYPCCKKTDLKISTTGNTDRL